MKRPVDLLNAVFLGLAATLGRVFFPTEPTAVWVLTGVLTTYALVFAGLSLKQRRTEPRPRWLLGVQALGLLPLLAVLGFMALHGFLLFYIFLRLWLPVIFVGAAVVLGLAIRAARQGRVSMDVLRVTVSVLVFASSVAYVPLCMWMWSSPSAESCDQIAEHPAVERLTPQRYPDERSFPYEMNYMAAEQRLATSFKMAGNLTIGIWDDPEANRLVVIDLKDPKEPVLAELALEGVPLPQYMTLGPSGDVLVVNRLGYERNLLDYVDLSGFPNLRLVKRIDTVAQPHDMRLVTGERILIATMRREIVLLDYHTGAVESVTRIPTWFATPGFTITGLTVEPDGPVAYASMLGTDVVRIDPTRGNAGVRARDVGFGAGEIGKDPLEPHLYETDFFQDSLRVIDSRTLDTIREIPLDFQPRPVAVVPKHDLVAVGAWMDGVVHLLRRSTGEPLNIALPVGPYLRELAVDQERGLLFAASKCGVSRIDLDALGL